MTEDEAAFREWYALRSRRILRWLTLVAMGPAIVSVVLSPISIPAQSVQLGFIATAALFVWLASEPIYARWWEPLALLVMLAILGSVLVLVVPGYRDSGRVDGNAAMITFLPMAAGFVACLRTRATMVVAVVALVGGSLQVARIPAMWPDGWAQLTIVFLMSGGMSGVASFQLERALRGEFVASRKLERERARSEKLLRNVLPAEIAERLKHSPGAIAERFPEATVLFADLVGFTPLAQQLPAERVVAILDELFSAFDDIADRHGLEKIKTIGDAYMVVGGVPAARTDHAHAVAAMALEMRDHVRHRAPHGTSLRLRIGIDTGPVVAGVIGKRKFLYDLWGDTVNTASRMESHGLDDAVQVTEATYQRLRDQFVLEARGEIEVKGKGAMSTYLLVGRC